MKRAKAGRLLIVILFGVLGAYIFRTIFPAYIDDLFWRLTEFNRGGPIGLESSTDNPRPTSEVKNVPPQGEQNNTVGDSSGEGDQGTSGEAGSGQAEDGQGNQATSDEPEAEPDSALNPPTGNLVGPIKPNLKEPVTIGEQEGVPKAPENELALTLLGFIVGAYLGTIALHRGDRFLDQWSRMTSGARVTIVLGILLGVIAGIVISIPFQFFYQGSSTSPLITVALVISCSAAIVYSLKAMSDYLPWETGIVSKRKTGTKILDTNILIDGRVYDLLNSGFIEGEIYIPRFVLQELQHIADSADQLRRQRGRRGLEILNRIKNQFGVEVGKKDKYAGTPKIDVDSRLVRLAKALGADLVSNDYNLNKVATVEGIKVLNINELALALRPTVLPGESLTVEITKEGSQRGQGLAYLDDGTMVVVENGLEMMGRTLDVNVTQVIQTERGKMIFASVPDEDRTANHG